ncbi:MAG: tetratricopeptide repeat protein [Bacteroidales bacterium]|nr:tetratricopeptide repeat protein [Bacteroidales bacterium]
MKKLFLLFIMITISLACFPQKGKWKKAQKINTIESYQTFLNVYPNTEYSDDAKLKIIELEFVKAERTNTISGYEYFLKEYEKNAYTEKAKSNLIELEYRNAEKQNTVEAFQQFINKYPYNELTEKAKSNLTELEYRNAEKQNTIEAFQQFINKYPYNELTEKAKSNLTELEYRNAEKQNTIEAFQQFINNYPEVEYTKIAGNKLSLLLNERNEWEKIVNNPTLNTYSLFKKEFPNSKMDLTGDMLNRMSKNALTSGHYYSKSNKKIKFLIDISGDSDYLVLTSGKNTIIKDGVRIYTEPGASGYKTYEDSTFDIEFFSDKVNPLVINITHIEYSLNLEYVSGKGYIIIETKRENKIWDLN